ncbi:MAG: hypothetical protein OIF57_04550 [Marinobacterium sp.]|nr:hypothetical protein [Marinobacterium sp.]
MFPLRHATALPHSRTLLPLLIALLLVAMPGPARATDENSMGQDSVPPVSYNVVLDEKIVGRYHYRSRRSADGSYIILVQSSLNAEGWLGNIVQNTSHIERYSAEGRLLEINKKVYDGSKVDWLKVQRQGEELWAYHTEVKNLSQKEQEELTALSVSLASHAIPGLGNLVTASQLLFSERPQPGEGSRFGYDEFDSSFEQLPFIWQRNQHSLPASLRILDSDTLAITHYQVVAQGGQYQLTDNDSNRITLSFTTTANNQPVFLAITGQDSDGTFAFNRQPDGTRQP